MLNKQTIEQLKEQIATINTQIINLESDIKDKQYEIDNFEYTISESDFDEILDCEGEVSTSVGSFYPSDILKSCDPIAYRCAKSDYEGNYDLDECEEYQDLQSELEDLESDLESLQDDLESLESDLDELKEQLDELENDEQSSIIM